MGVPPPTELSPTMKRFRGAGSLNSKKLLPCWRLKKAPRAVVGGLNKKLSVPPDFAPTPIIATQPLYLFAPSLATIPEHSFQPQ